MSARQWPTDEQFEALFERAAATRSHAVRFDPDAPGGFRALTPQEDRELLDAIALPAQRHDEDRAHLAAEQEAAEQAGDREAVAMAGEHLRVLDDERARDQRHDPRLGPEFPTRDELDGMSPATRDEARTWEFLDARREIADERATAEARGDLEATTELDQQERAVTDVWRAAHDVHAELDDEERER